MCGFLNNDSCARYISKTLLSTITIPPILFTSTYAYLWLLVPVFHHSGEIMFAFKQTKLSIYSYNCDKWDFLNVYYHRLSKIQPFISSLGSTMRQLLSGAQHFLWRGCMVHKRGWSRRVKWTTGGQGRGLGDETGAFWECR